MKEFIKEFIGILVLIGVSVLVTVVGLSIVDGTKCERQATMMGLNYNYSIITQCMVQTQDGWIPMKQLRGLRQ